MHINSTYYDPSQDEYIGRSVGLKDLSTHCFVLVVRNTNLPVKDMRPRSLISGIFYE